jgi:hypothetical protein
MASASVSVPESVKELSIRLQNWCADLWHADARSRAVLFDVPVEADHALVWKLLALARLGVEELSDSAHGGWAAHALAGCEVPHVVFIRAFDREAGASTQA